jgi:hypothetical protein
METWETHSEETAPTESPEPIESPSESPPPVDASSSEPSAPDSTESSSSSEPGFLTGTASEQAPGIGDSTHPAPAAIIGEDGQLHVAGEPPVGNIAPSLPQPDPPASGPTDEENIAKLNAVTEPEPQETNRPDIGTPTEE